jgi:hypothetical protein
MDYRVHVATWNVGSVAPDSSFDLRRLLHSTFEDNSLPDIIIIGLQEVVELDQVGAYVNQDETRVRQWEVELDKASFALAGNTKKHPFKKVLVHQLVGVALFVYVNTSRLAEVSNIQVTTVGVGLLGLGNKGAVVASFRLCQTTECCIVCAHLAAHVGELTARNQNFLDIVQQAEFEASESDDDETTDDNDGGEKACTVYRGREPTSRPEEYSMWASAAGMFEAAASSAAGESPYMSANPVQTPTAAYVKPI